MIQYLIKFFITFVIFMGIDLLWLGILARKMYVSVMGHLLRSPPNWTAANIFYILFNIGLIIFAIEPAIKDQSIKKAIILGGLYGFFTYMTYNLTNWAVLKDWPSKIVLVDIIWGTILSASVASLSTWVYLRFFT